MESGWYVVIVVAILALASLIREFIIQFGQKKDSEVIFDKVWEDPKIMTIGEKPSKNKCAWLHCKKIPIYKILDEQKRTIDYVCEDHLMIKEIISFVSHTKVTHELVE